MNYELINKIDHLLNELAVRIENGAKEDAIVYHYTSYEGVLGILREQNVFPVFYFSQYDRTNDSSEGYDLVLKYQNAVNSLYSQNRVGYE